MIIRCWFVINCSIMFLAWEQRLIKYFRFIPARLSHHQGETFSTGESHYLLKETGVASSDLCHHIKISSREKYEGCDDADIFKFFTGSVFNVLTQFSPDTLLGPSNSCVSRCEGRSWESWYQGRDTGHQQFRHMLQFRCLHTANLISRGERTQTWALIVDKCDQEGAVSCHLGGPMLTRLRNRKQNVRGVSGDVENVTGISGLRQRCAEHCSSCNCLQDHQPWNISLNQMLIF